jgi:hypothetical protein
MFRLVGTNMGWNGPLLAALLSISISPKFTPYRHTSVLAGSDTRTKGGQHVAHSIHVVNVRHIVKNLESGQHLCSDVTKL